MRDALERIGFFFIINHGIPKSLRDKLVEATARFYALPLEQKMALKVNEEGNGYVPTRGELPKTSPYYTGTRKPDVSECYLLQRDWGPRSSAHAESMAREWEWLSYYRDGVL